MFYNFDLYSMGCSLHQHGHTHGGGSSHSHGSDSSAPQHGHSHGSDGSTPHGHSHGESNGVETDYEAQARAISEEAKRRENINVRAAFIHVIGDFIQSLGVFIAALIIYFYPHLVKIILEQNRDQKFPKNLCCFINF